MGKARSLESSLLFVGTLYSDSGIYHHTKGILENDFGSILFESPSMPWDYSTYYRDELGWPIFRQFIFFKNTIDPGILADVKIKTNEIEESVASDGKRRINLDPGYLTLSKIVLASTKNYAHRIYLGKGIYAEVTLMYRDDTFKPHLFTYSDYQDKAYIDIFLDMRARLKNRLE